MAQGNQYARIINAMRHEGSYNNGYEMEVATVLSRKPLSIKIGEDIIAEGIYCNVFATSEIELEDIIKKEEQLSEELKHYLKESYQAVRLNEGDMVLVQRVRNAFYICGKVGKAGMV